MIICFIPISLAITVPAPLTNRCNALGAGNAPTSGTLPAKMPHFAGNPPFPGSITGIQTALTISGRGLCVLLGDSCFTW